MFKIHMVSPTLAGFHFHCHYLHQCRPPPHHHNIKNISLADPEFPQSSSFWDDHCCHNHFRHHRHPIFSLSSTPFSTSALVIFVVVNDDILVSIMCATNPRFHHHNQTRFSPSWPSQITSRSSANHKLGCSSLCILLKMLCFFNHVNCTIVTRRHYILSTL